jgi:hypothetical protein
MIVARPEPDIVGGVSAAAARLRFGGMHSFFAESFHSCSTRLPANSQAEPGIEQVSGDIPGAPWQNRFAGPHRSSIIIALH